MPDQIQSPERVFRGSTLAATLAEVKRTFGPHAVIVRTRNVSTKGPGALLGRTIVEITAAPATAIGPDRGSRISRPTPARLAEMSTPAAPAPNSSASADQLRAEIADIRRLVTQLVASQRPITNAVAKVTIDAGPLAGPLFACAARLRDGGLDNSVLQLVIEQVRRTLPIEQAEDAARVRDAVIDAIGERIAVVDRSQPARGTIAVVGPTGAGKTTTIAKLAAEAKLRRGRRVALITLDTFRIAAVEQLRTYGRLLEIPVVVVRSLHDVAAALQATNDADTTLIDTPGCSPTDHARIAHIASLLSACRVETRALAIPAATSTATSQRLVNAFAPCAPSELILSKVDECGGGGELVGAAAGTELPTSWITTGQSVPEDLEPATRSRLGSIVLHGFTGDGVAA